MTPVTAAAALATKGFRLSSCFRLAPEMGFMASSRPIKGAASTGEAGFGQTEILALVDLLTQHGIQPPTPQVRIDDDLAALLGLS